MSLKRSIRHSSGLSRASPLLVPARQVYTEVEYRGVPNVNGPGPRRAEQRGDDVAQDAAVGDHQNHRVVAVVTHRRPHDALGPVPARPQRLGAGDADRAHLAQVNARELPHSLVPCEPLDYADVYLLQVVPGHWLQPPQTGQHRRRVKAALQGAAVDVRRPKPLGLEASPQRLSLLPPGRRKTERGRRRLPLEPVLGVGVRLGMSHEDQSHRESPPRPAGDIPPSSSVSRSAVSS